MGFIMKNKGAALITVLLIVFIVMAIITNMTVKNYRVIKKLTNQKIETQAYSILFTAIDLARAGLLTSGATSKIDTLTDLWAQPIPKTSLLENIDMSGQIFDEQGKFNVNDLVINGNINRKAINQFSTLLGYLSIPTSLASSIAYYMAAPKYQSDIMSQYSTGNPAYRPAGRPLIDLSELMLVKGMRADWVYKLSFYLTAIPQPFSSYAIGYSKESNSQEDKKNQTPPPITDSTGMLININTASAEVIAAKSGIPLSIAQRAVASRNDKPFKTNEDITKFLRNNGIIASQDNGQNSTNIDPSTLTTQSSYFTVHAVVDSGNYQFKWIALLYRNDRNGQWPKILWQHPE